MQLSKMFCFSLILFSAFDVFIYFNIKFKKKENTWLKHEANKYFGSTDV